MRYIPMQIDRKLSNKARKAFWEKVNSSGGIYRKSVTKRTPTVNSQPDQKRTVRRPNDKSGFIPKEDI